MLIFCQISIQDSVFLVCHRIFITYVRRGVTSSSVPAFIIPPAAGAVLETVPPATPETPTPRLHQDSTSALGTLQTSPDLFTSPFNRHLLAAVYSFIGWWNFH